LDGAAGADVSEHEQPAGAPIEQERLQTGEIRAPKSAITLLSFWSNRSIDSWRSLENSCVCPHTTTYIVVPLSLFHSDSKSIRKLSRR